MPSIDIDRDAAHRAAQAELDKPAYSRGSPLQQLSDWVSEQLYRLLEKTASLPGGWFTAAALFILLTVAVVVTVRLARRTLRTRRGEAALFETTQLTAAQHRATAESLAVQGDWAAAIRHRLRAVARQLEEAGVLDAAPGRTATELARDAGLALSHLSGELSEAARTFNDVTYGERPGTQPEYQVIADLDEHLLSRSPAAAAAPVGTVEPWAQVR
ncbi:DUF4129 domain-containing protein [Mycobacterium sp. THU-M104]|uniref:DUF4129 domain-containing protein n=1 Tax=Mycobacterium sp. THU-M104 TaxID=3410515 RepID=UPI003B99097A